MVATDTVVGIIGAVVLVAVMGGVFVYEYNNAPGADAEADAMEHFEEDYAGMVATQDLDGDGVANWEDLDIDGDGVNNTDDEEVTQTVPVQNVNVPAPSPTGGNGVATVKFDVINGSIHFEGSMSYTRTGGTVPNIQASLSGPAGFDPVAATSSASGNTQTLSFDIEGGLPPGSYTLTFTNQPTGGVVPVGQAGTVSGSLLVHYAAPAEGHGH